MAKTQYSFSHDATLKGEWSYPCSPVHRSTGYLSVLRWGRSCNFLEAVRAGRRCEKCSALVCCQLTFVCSVGELLHGQDAVQLQP
jgi:hypothetical protein